MKNEIIIYISNNILNCYLKREKKYYTWNLSSKIMKYGKIIHRPKFQKELTFFFKKEKILKKFQKNILYFLVPPNFEEIDKEILKLSVEDINIYELKIIKENNLYSLRKNIMWINLNENYAYLSIKTNHHMLTILWNSSQGYSLIDFIKIQLKNYPKIKKLILIGSNRKIPEISNQLFVATKKRVLYYEEYDKYLIKTFLRHNLL